MIPTDCSADAASHPWDAQITHSIPNIHVYFTPMVGDINGDGIVEIVAGIYTTNNHYTTQVGIFRGTDLHQIGTINVYQQIYAGWAGPIALVRYPNENGGMQGAIILHCFDHKLRSYDTQGNLLNTSDVNTPCDGAISVTDFNGDGYPEVYVGNAVFDAATLKRLCAGSPNGSMGLCHRGSSTDHGHIAMSFASNILGDARPELICGNTIYTVEINSRTDASLNSVSVLKTIPLPSHIPPQGNVAVADFNQDGQLDILVVIDNTSNDIDDTTHVYAYDPVTEDILFCHSEYAKTIGYPLVGDIDGDSHLEFVFINDKVPVSQARIRAMKYTPGIGLTEKWNMTHTDESGQTSMTLFDFNQDGVMEIVYRDQYNLRIMNGSGRSHFTGNDTIPCYNLYTSPMESGTWNEYPTIADINGDGAAEIVVAGRIGPGPNWVIQGHLNVVAGIHTWAPARPVWNQYMYNVTNINKDLTVPVPLFDNATAFTDPQGTVRRPFNNFLEQATTLDQYGRPFARLANLEISDILNLDFNSTETLLEINVCNYGELIFESPLQISVFASTGELVHYEELDMTLMPDECTVVTLNISQDLINQLDNPYPIRVVLNCNNMGIAQYGGLQAECDTMDNIAIIDNHPCEITLPNVITPNGDNVNDVFMPQLEGDLSYMKMDIYNRWGKQVFQQEGKEVLSWDAANESDGVFYCTVEYQCIASGKKRKFTNTSITVIR
ncbi:MAG: FG-GAP-like repeat-containing protein [Bacteroidales bacterium]|nr:FG-GAP-like repeat-containing protein [Bacteroidales bacterium]